MSSLKQIEANRLNAQHSTGPRSIAGKAAVRFNALKTGIDAKSQVIPGEDPAALTLLADEYYDRYHPATPEVRALVDALITAEWLQRRFRALEAQLWQYGIPGLYHPTEGLEVAQVYVRENEVFGRLQRRIDAAERTYHRTLLALQKIESLHPQPSSPAPAPPSPDPEPPTNQPHGSEIGETKPISDPPPCESVPARPCPWPPAPGPASEASPTRTLPPAKIILVP